MIEPGSTPGESDPNDHMVTHDGVSFSCLTEDHSSSWPVGKTLPPGAGHITTVLERESDNI